MKRRCWLGLLLILISTSQLAVGQIIAHKAVPQSAISRSELLTVFTMRRQRWPDGMILQVFVLPDENIIHRNFVKQSLGIFPYQLRSIWDRIIFSGAGSAPTLVINEAQMIMRVASTPGAIGYISDIMQGDENGIKILVLQ